jgi:hypothetical protein
VAVVRALCLYRFSRLQSDEHHSTQSYRLTVSYFYSLLSSTYTTESFVVVAGYWSGGLMYMPVEIWAKTIVEEKSWTAKTEGQ